MPKISHTQARGTKNNQFFDSRSSRRTVTNPDALKEYGAKTAALSKKHFYNLDSDYQANDFSVHKSRASRIRTELSQKSFLDPERASNSSHKRIETIQNRVTKLQLKLDNDRQRTINARMSQFFFRKHQSKL